MNCKLAQSWYNRFDSGNVTILDEPKSDRHKGSHKGYRCIKSSQKYEEIDIVT